MIRFFMILLMILLTCQSYLQAQGFSTKLTFITNESFIIEDSTNKILIDYDHRSTLNNKKYQNLQPPFDNIDLINSF